MLVNFRFKNCRSFYDETDLSLQATTDETKREINTFFAEKRLLPEDERELLKSAVIFGSNASGKTNVIKAFAYMLNVVSLSSAQFPVVSQNEYFALKEDALMQSSLYEAEFIHNGIYYKYGFELNKGSVVKEWLFKRKGRLENVFERKGSKLSMMGVQKTELNLIKIPAATLFISIGKNFNLPINKYLNDVIEWFLSNFIVFENVANMLDIYTIFDGKYKKLALDILKLADIGITDIEVIKDKLANVNNPQDILILNTQMQTNPTFMRGQLKTEKENLYRIDMLTKFDVYNDKNERVGEKNALLFKDSGYNSEGTVRLLCYLGWILAALDQGRTIFIDEIDSKLHFLVADYIIGLFNSIEYNPKNAQLICTAHNVLLMDDGLRRDQIYFTSKDKYGKSVLVSLADYKGVRKTDLFSKRYLAGFYTKLPDLKR